MHTAASGRVHVCHHGVTTWFLDFRVPKEHPHSAREAFPDSRLWPLLSGGDVEGMAPGQLCALPFFCVQQGAGCCALLLTGGGCTCKQPQVPATAPCAALCRR